MNRTTLLAGALTGLATTATAQSSMNGGGTVTAGPNYIMEQHKFCIGCGGTATRPPTKPATAPPGPPATFSTYWQAGSAVGQLAFLADDLSCDINAVTGKNGGRCDGTGATVHYAASDIVLNAAQISSWATGSVGQSAAGDLIQIPSMGAGVAIPVNNPKIAVNGALMLSDNDVCGIFSGLITDFSQIADSQTQPAPGMFKLVYSTDGEGPTFWLTNHLAAVCTARNANITFRPTTDLASLFAGGKPPANFVAQPSSVAVASFMAGCSGAQPFALGYLTPDLTLVDPNSSTMLTCAINGSTHSPLVAAAVVSGGAAVLPTVSSIALGLTNAAKGSNLKPPANAQQGANPALWVPQVQTVKQGYPIVGYTTFDVAQCYADPNIPAALIQFLGLHYTKGAYAKIENANGFATLAQVKRNRFLAAVQNGILGNASGWNDNIANPVVCAAYPGR